jgi:hypothetical protein
LKLERGSSDDFAKQLLTAMITLVTAVAAFYFGTRSVQAARGELNSPSPVIIGVEPPTSAAGNDVKIVIVGRNLRIPRSVSLSFGQSVIQCRDIMASESRITCTIDILVSHAKGPYNLIVANNDGSESFLSNAFEVT